jgi:hypothetical protein
MSTEATTPPPSPFDDEPNATTDAAVSSNAVPPKPRLSILHLMVWTATSAAMMAFYNLIISLQPSNERNDNLTNSPVGMMLRTIWSMRAGSSLGGVLLLVSRRRRKLAFPSEPGEWLLVTLGVGTSINLALYFIFAVTQAGQPYNYPLVLAFHLIRQLIDVGEFMLPALMCKNDRDWRKFFWACTVVAILAASLTLLGFVVGQAFFWITKPGWVRWLPMALCATVYGVAVVDDLRQHQDRGWVHWVGVVSIAFLFLNNEGWNIYVYYFAP